MSMLTLDSGVSGSKPVKLRAACNQCSSVKMKCTGERTGCQRCVNISVQCIYAESRVGKVPGVRAKRRYQSNTEGNSSNESPPGFQAPDIALGARAEESAIDEEFDEDSIVWSAGLQYPFNAEMGTFDSADDSFQGLYPIQSPTTPSVIQPSSSASIPTLSSATSDFFLGNLNFGMEELVRTSNRLDSNIIGTRSSPCQQVQQSQPKPQKQTQQNRQGAVAVDSQCILACCQIISSLENYILADLNVLDIILGTVKRTVDKLNVMVNLQLESRNMRCIALFGVIMDQIIVLLEAGSQSFFAQNRSQWPQELTAGLDYFGNTSLNLGFETFQVDPEDKRAWGSKIILKELQHCIEFLHKLMPLVRIGLNNGQPSMLHEHVPDAVSASPSDASKENLPTIEGEVETPAPKHSWRFWLIIIAMCLCAFTSSLDTLIITTALPRVTESIGGEQQYVWIANSFLFASTVIQPLYGQVSNIFGRRMPMLVALSLFAIGSGIGGGAVNVPMLISGRTVQGLGTGGIFVMSDLIICDLVPLRERAKYMGMVLSTAAIGTAIGPVVGGGLAQADWRWVFYINLPISIPALIMLFFFLQLNYKREPTWAAALLRVDWLGNLIFIPSILAILLGLVMGGTVFPWSSWHIILPIVLGGVGWILFHVHQASPICKEPSVPPHLFSNRTSCIGFLLAFNSAMILNWSAYFLPFYFQASQGTNPVLSGVYVLPFTLFMVPAAMVAGGLLAKFGQYKPFHWIGFGLFALAAGLLSTLDTSSPRAAWICYQILGAIGLGLILTTILPAILASLEESDAAVATSTFSFLRSFGYTFGVTIPSVIFNGQFDKLSYRISDPLLRSELGNGAAYGYASSGLISSLPEDIQSEVRGVYSDSIKTTWQVALGFALLGFLLVVVEKRVKLRTELETEFGLKEPQKKKAEPEDGNTKEFITEEVKVDGGVST
ncbi:hypothetical protein G7Y89_g1954 [Cudoniella acicularis]|uniref:Major facilitator superfamily (MFS) profile domain-containing protein n=1 Tax=Cudoniella acicularis TaxID=354080 RepID=A0A8H4W928_9HELO|nr:hypothetical protein G7Y89_g1954 [Cudoniella acicularis]